MRRKKITLLLVLIIMVQLMWLPQASMSSDSQIIPMAATIYVNGTVTNNTGGVPVDGANVTFFNASTGAYVASTLTNSTGFYNITLGSGTYNISATAPDYYTAWIRNISLSVNTTQNMTIFEIPGRIEGAVGDSVHPLSGIIVNITYIPINKTTPEVKSTVSGAWGNFTLENITAGSYPIEISATGYPAEQHNITVAWNTTSSITIHLSGATMKGAIKDDGGSPLTASVSVENGTAWFNTTSGTDGIYSVSGLRAGEYNITVTKSGYVRYENQSIAVAAGATLWENGTLFGGKLAGNVTDNAGRSIAGASVRLSKSGGEIISAPSSPNGSFELSSVPTGDYVLTVSKSGYMQSSKNVHITAGQTIYRDVILTGGSVCGSIWDDAGRAIADATVELLGTGYAAKSNISGNYSVDGVAEGDYYVRASHDGYMISTSEATIHLSPGEAVFHNFTLRGGTLTGIIDNGTALLRGVNVTIILTTGVNLSTETDSNGRYIIKGIPGGVYAMTAGLAGYHNSTIGGIVITAGETTTQDVTMEELQGKISGCVRSSTGPIEGARVWVSIPDGIKFSYTGADGNYTITDVPAGIYNVTAEKSGYYSDYVPDVMVIRGETTNDINFTLEGKLSRLSGIVSNGTYPIVGVNIEILELKYSTYTDPYGAYELENIPPGTYTVTATKQGYRANATYGVVIERGGSVELNFTLEEIPGIVWGYVKDANGEAIVQATVEISGESYSTTTDINGYYKLAGIAPGVYVLTVYKSGYESSVISGVNITTEYENHVDVTLNPTGNTGNDKNWTIIPGMDMVHSFMVIGLIIVLGLMFISIIYTHRYGRKFANTRFMDMLKEMASEEKGESDEGEKTEEENEGGAEDAGAPPSPSKKKTKKKRLKKGKK